MQKELTFHRFGENALLIKWGQQIDETIHQQVMHLETIIKAAKLPTVTFTIPAYCSLTVGYDATQIDYETICLLISNLTSAENDNKPQSTTRQLTIPVCYDLEFALDIQQLAKEKKLTQKKIIQYHSEPTDKVYMLGFLPGFTFMGKIPTPITCKRKREPRLKVPALSVGIAGEQTGIYPAEVPGGWQIVGRTPIPIFDPKKENPFLFQAGDSVQFYPISKKDYVSIQKDIAIDSFNWQAIYG